VKHFAYAAGWKKFEFLWNAVIRGRQLRVMTPVLEAVLSKVSAKGRNKTRCRVRDEVLIEGPGVIARR